MKSIVDQSHDFLKDVLHKGAICIDATLGWGKDTDFKADVRNYIVQQTEADIAHSHIDANSQLEAMLNSGQDIQNTGKVGY